MQSDRELINKLYHRCSVPLNGFKVTREEQAEAQRRFGAMLAEYLGETIHMGIRSANYHNEDRPCGQALRSVYRVFADIERALQIMEQEHSDLYEDPREGSDYDEPDYGPDNIGLVPPGV